MSEKDGRPRLTPVDGHHAAQSALDELENNHQAEDLQAAAAHVHHEALATRQPDPSARPKCGLGA
jgi:hypothetical protein